MIFGDKTTDLWGMKMGVTDHWEGGLIPKSEATDPVQWGLFPWINEAKATEFKSLNYWPLGMRVLFHRNDATGLWE